MKKSIFLMLFLFAGTFLFAQTKTMVKVADLQKPITEYIAKNYAGYMVEKAYKVDNKGILNYETIVMKNNSRDLLVFDKDGKFLKQEALKAETHTATMAQPAKKEEAKPAATGTKK